MAVACSKIKLAMPTNYTELKKRLWETADELRVNCQLKSLEYSAQTTTACSSPKSSQLIPTAAARPNNLN
jgi:hypothetical protein